MCDFIICKEKANGIAKRTLSRWLLSIKRRISLIKTIFLDFYFKENYIPTETILFQKNKLKGGCIFENNGFLFAVGEFLILFIKITMAFYNKEITECEYLMETAIIILRFLLKVDKILEN